MQLTKHFNSSEFEKSATADKYKIINVVPDKYFQNLKNLADVLEKIRVEWGEPINVTSGYRCPALNAKVGGAKTSQHMNAAAADIVAKDKSKNKDLFNLIVNMAKTGKISCRQILWEYGTKTNPNWIHIAINDSAHSYRNNQILYLYS